MSKSITVAQLIKVLQKQPPHYQVYTSSDPEGNGYGSLQAAYSFGGSNPDKVLVLYPIEEFQAEDIMPLELERDIEEATK